MSTQAREYPGTFDETIDDPRDYEPPGNKANDKGQSTRFTIKRFEDIKPSTAPNYLVRGLLPREGLATIWGPPKSGKSFVAFDIAMHIALGRNYRGRKVRQGTVVYLALEGGAGFSSRVEAWRQRHLANYSERVPFHLIDVPLDLIAEHGALIAAIREQVEDAPAAVFVDTLNRALVGDENSPVDMAKLIKACGALELAFGCLVPMIHHCGVVGTRPRGHTSLAGANNAQINVSKDEHGLVTVTAEHAKDMACGTPFACRLESVKIGHDDNDDPMTSCVVMPAEAKEQGPKLSAAPKLTLDLLQALVATDSKPPAPSDNIPAKARPVSAITWRERFYDAYPTRPDAKQKAFVRAQLKLINLKLVEVWSTYAWLTSKPDISDIADF
jgi:AAA domain